MLRTAAALAAVLLLAGCVPGEPVITPEPDPDATPVFASGEEALAAATEAYARYLEVSDQITADAGADPNRLKPFVTEKQLQDEVTAFEEWSQSGDSSVGESTFDTVTLQQYAEEPDGHGTLTVYLCVDVSDVRIVDAQGTDTTPKERINRYPLEVSFDVVDADTVLIARSESWPAANYCS
ncbi:MAG TPA: hypothetical protein VFS93_05120 [Terrimesophilobacter sp.]|nr:hypothetical protein [Terrimesophilobacter sp.]